MSSGEPVASVVVETYNGAGEGLEALVRALDGQDFPAGAYETIVVADEAATWTGAFRRRHPHVRVETIRAGRYFTMKNRGASLARGRVVAFVDADCAVGPGWLAAAVAAIDDGADVAVGTMRYAAGRGRAVPDAFSWALDVQRPTTIYSSNVAFRAEVIQASPFDERPYRSGGCYLLARRLLARGHRFVAVPGMHADHEFVLLHWLANRMRAGGDAARLPRFDEERVLPETRLKPFGPLAPAVVAAMRMASDVRRLHRRPLVLAASPVVRGVEMVGGLLALVRPGVFARRLQA